LRILRDHGSEERYHHQQFGFKARMDEIQAAVLRIKLRHLDEWNELRRQHALRYDALLQDAGVTLPQVGPDRVHAYYVYVIRSHDRDRLHEQLSNAGIGTGIHFPIPVHLQPASAELGYAPGDLPVTEQAAQEVLSLPMYAELTDEQLREVAQQVKLARQATLQR
jgi:dTDP-4-amino-4,6-dideoxygalactose transaminase